MLIRFNVKNFLSFAESEDGKSEEFSMIAGKARNKKEHIYDDGKLKLLKFAAVYGANASGKSNLVKALQFMRKVVLLGLPKGHSEQFCKSNLENSKKPSYFELELSLDGKYYAYGFEVVLRESRFVGEWLYEIRSDNSQELLFERNIEEEKYEFDGALKKNKFVYEKLCGYAKDIRSDDSILFLSVMNQNKKDFYQDNPDAMILRKVHNWIAYNLNINFPNRPISDYSYMAESETNKVEEVCKLIKTFGTGITDYRIDEVKLEEVLNELPGKLREKIRSDIERNQAKLRKSKSLKKCNIVMRSSKDFFMIEVFEEKISCKTIKFYHGQKDVLFQMAEESDGTVRILDLLEILLSGEGETYVIDELDRCLHPCLTYKFVETFLKLAKRKNIQLIVTTHESRLMDFDLLRRDEIWFVNKRISGESDIYSLEEYNTRFDQKIDKAYLEGRYGGVPVFTTLFPIVEE